MCAGHNNHYKNVTSAINEYLWPEKKVRYSTKDISRLKGLILDCSEARDAERVLLEALSIVTGMRWETRPEALPIYKALEDGIRAAERTACKGGWPDFV